MDTVALTLRLPSEIHERLRQEAFDKRVSITSLIISALDAPDREATYDAIFASEPDTRDGTGV